MNAILEQINSAGLKFLEFALPMFVQSVVLIVILLLADFALRKKVRAVFRYWIWLLVLLKLVLPTSLSSPMSLGYFFGNRLTYVDTTETPSEPQINVVQPVPASVPPFIDLTDIETDRFTPPAPPIMPEAGPAVTSPAVPPVISVTPLSWQGAVFLTWLTAVIAMVLLLLQRAIFVRGLVAQAKEANGFMADSLESCRISMSVKRKLGLKVSPNATSPAVCGLFRPVILVPQNLTSSLTAGQLRAVLLHELAHIKRGDLFVNLAQTVLQIFYFYNPLLWLANYIIRRIREQAVDEMVLVAMGEKAPQYPQTLVSVAKLAFKRPVLSLRLIGVVESKSALSARIKHILNRPIPKKAKLGIIGLVVVIIIGAILLPMASSMPGLPGLVIKGIVKDAQTGEPVAGARVFDDGYGPEPVWEQIRPDQRCQWGAITNSAGRYSFLTWPEHHSIKVQAPGYKAQRRSLYSGHFTLNKKDQEIFDFTLEPEKVSELSEFKTTLSNGVTVELIGLCEHPIEGTQWWRPDGGILASDHVPSDHSRMTVKRDGTEQARELALRFSGPYIEYMSFRWKIDKATRSSSHPFYMTEKREKLKPQRNIVFKLPRNIETLNFNAGVAVGEWKRVASGGDGRTVSGTNDSLTDSSVIFHEAIKEKDKVKLSATHLLGGDYDCRIMVVDKDDKLHKPVRSSNSGSDMRLCRGFFDLSQEQIKYILLQARPYRWIEFKNVSLKPNFKTDVQVDAEGAKSKTPQPAKDSISTARRYFSRGEGVLMLEGFYSFGEGEMYSERLSQIFSKAQTYIEQMSADYENKDWDNFSEAAIQVRDIFFSLKEAIEVDDAAAWEAFTKMWKGEKTDVNDVRLVDLARLKHTFEILVFVGGEYHEETHQNLCTSIINIADVADEIQKTLRTKRPTMISSHIEKLQADWAVLAEIEGIKKIFQSGFRTEEKTDVQLEPETDWVIEDYGQTRLLSKKETPDTDNWVSIWASAVKNKGRYLVPDRGLTLKGLIKAAGYNRDKLAQSYVELFRRSQQGNITTRSTYSRNLKTLLSGEESDVVIKPHDAVAGGYIEPSANGIEFWSGYHFSEVVELTVNDDGAKINMFADLDTGKLVTPPDTLNNNDKNAVLRWIKNNGIDVMGETAESVHGLVGFNMYAARVDNYFWDAGPQEVTDRLMVRIDVPVLLSVESLLPVTYLIKTSKYKMGILQILGFVENPKGIKIRYKLLNKEATLEPDVQVGPELVVGDWQYIGQSIPPDFNDTLILTEHVNLGSIGHDAEGKTFITLFRDREKTKALQYRFVLFNKAGNILEPDGHIVLGESERLEEKFTFDEPFITRRLKGFRFQARPLPPSGFDNISSILQKVAPEEIQDEKISPSSLAPPGRYAVELDGVDDYLLVPDSPSLRLEPPFTIEMWIKTKLPPDATEYRGGWALISKGFTVGTPRAYLTGFGINLDRRPNKPSQLYIDYCKANNSGTYSATYAGYPLTNGVSDWIHIHHVFEGKYYKSAPGHPLVMGKFLIPTENPFKGLLGEVRLWNGARSRQELHQYENVALAGTEPGLAACWTFEQTEGRYAYDITGNNNHARLGKFSGTDDADPKWVDLQVPSPQPNPKTDAQVSKPVKQPETQAVNNRIPLKVDYPEPSSDWYDTYHRIGTRSRGKKLAEKPPLVLVPSDVTNVAKGKPVTSTDAMLILGELEYITDGDKRPRYYVEYEPKELPQHVTIDLEREYEIYAVVWWHCYDRAAIYWDVVVQVGRDPKFEDAVILFNNDHDGSLGLGKGTDLNYIETNEGWMAGADGVVGRYVRLYNHTNSNNMINQYTEVEVYGRLKVAQLDNIDFGLRRTERKLQTYVRRQYPVQLIWPLIQDASKYVIRIHGLRGSQPAKSFESVTNRLHLNESDIAPGRYQWSVSVYDEQGKLMSDIETIEPDEIFAIEDPQPVAKNGKKVMIDLNHSAGLMRGWGYYNHAQYMTKELLENAGFEVQVNDRDLLTDSSLKSVDLLICNYYWTGWPEFRPYLKSELSAVQQFVEGGGSLLVVGCDGKDGGGNMCTAGNELLSQFGLTFELSGRSKESGMAETLSRQNIISFEKPVPLQLPVSVQGGNALTLLRFEGEPIVKARQIGQGRVIAAGVGMSFLDCYLADFKNRQPLHSIMFYDFVRYLTRIDWKQSCKQGFIEKILSRYQF